jgi:hypothetical protein
MMNSPMLGRGQQKLLHVENSLIKKRRRNSSADKSEVFVMFVRCRAAGVPEDLDDGWIYSAFVSRLVCVFARSSPLGTSPG